ncbi:uncharacterized protein TM35_000381590 [Trypanosoma theileri]|nr:uncharacterized protein TM35_000381590 [Trypanosoma theileri]ORC85084.1 hypothetical protein TM35_000381590 [Trypanosoma theileri]
MNADTPVSSPAAPKQTTLLYRRSSLVKRPPVVLPPNDVSRSIHGRQPNPDHLATLLAALTEDTAHFAISKEKTEEEVEKLREELRKQQAETARLLQTNISLEAQRAQLLVQRDAQVMKLNSSTIHQNSQAKIRDVDDLLLNEELVQMLEVLQQQKEQRLAEITNVRAAIDDIRNNIEKQEKLVLLVREYWRRNAAAMKRVKNAAGRRLGRESISSAIVETSMMDSPSQTIWRRFNTTVPPALLSSEAAGIARVSPTPTTGTGTGMGRNTAEGKSNNVYQSIPALGLKEPDEVAEFIYSVFEELGVGSTATAGNEEL